MDRCARRLRHRPGGSDLVRKEGLEPTSLSALEPKSSASTNSATFAVAELYPKKAPFRDRRRRTGGRYNAENSSASDARVPVEHYENFPVASWLLPRALRPPIEAIYAFARGADDIADEGDADEAERLAGLDRYVRALDAIEAGTTPAEPPFARIAWAIREYRLPVPLLRDLLDAFRQDVVKKRYATYEELLDYSRRSANPVGRLVLHVFEATSPSPRPSPKGEGESAPSPRPSPKGGGALPPSPLGEGRGEGESDCICSALQFINFWQDVPLDWRKGRVYIPQEDLRAFGVSEMDIAVHRADARWRDLMAFECERSRELLMRGAPLARALPGRLGLEIRATVAGGAAILDRIDAVAGDVFRHRPVLGARDWIRILIKALMKTGDGP
jgi:phytoene/squalene synthetase